MFAPERSKPVGTNFGSLNRKSRSASRHNRIAGPFEMAGSTPEMNGPSTKAISKERGFQPSDLGDPQKKSFLTALTNRVFHLKMEEEAAHPIPLERVLRAPSHIEEVLPKKRKLYGSSYFYRTDHPTIEDQVKLAHKISVSLVDDVNRASKGQSMYMKRKTKSVKWIHAGQNASSDDMTAPKESKNPPALKLILNPKGVHDYKTMDEETERAITPLMSPQAIPAFGQPIFFSNQPLTGKGVELFAKRKKRTDKFIYGDNELQKSASCISLGNYRNEKDTNKPTCIPIQEFRAEVVASPPTIFPAYRGNLLRRSSMDDLAEKRKSFNLAAKGWGTYNDFYSSVKLGNH